MWCVHMHNEPIKEYADHVGVIFKPYNAMFCGQALCYNCCSGCAMWHSHFRFEGVLDKACDVEMIKQFKACAQANTQYEALKEKYKWDPHHGFLIPRVGCCLPMEERSVRCLSNICTTMQDMIEEPTVELINKLCDKIKEYRISHHMIY